MMIVFANNQSMTAIYGTDSVIFTDPVPLNELDRANPVQDVHYLWQTAGTAQLDTRLEFSNDGNEWQPISALDLSASSANVGTTQWLAALSIYGAFIRYKFTLKFLSGSPGDLAGVCFDLHLNCNKS